MRGSFRFVPALGLAAGVVLVVLRAPAIQHEHQRRAVEVTRPGVPETVGDSVTAANSSTIHDLRVSDGSCASYATNGRVRFFGLWASGGATTGASLADVETIRADALVIVAGSNDSRFAVRVASNAANSRAVVTKTRTHARIVSFSSLQVSDSRDRDLHTLAKRIGRTCVDAMRGARASNGVFGPGDTLGVIDPTRTAASTIDRALRFAILTEAS